MSDVVWCDYGGHFMSANDPDREFFTQDGNAYGQNQRQKRIDTCAEHRAPVVDFPTMSGIRDLQDRLQALEGPRDSSGESTNGG